MQKNNFLLKLVHSLFYLMIFSLLIGVYSCDKDEDDPDPDPDVLNQETYDAADGINGGKLYSKFWASETGWSVPTGITEDNITDYSNFYRCKQCHGWDLDGNTGAYINRAPKSSRPDVAGSIRSFLSSSTNTELFDAIKNTGGGAVDPTRTADGTDVSLGGNTHPDYGTILSDAEIWDLVKFLKEEAYDVSELYTITTTGAYPDGSKTFSDVGKDGDAATGNTFYTANCASCHGADGTTLIIEDLSIGQFVRDKCYETQHKVKFGHLGSSMTGVPTATVDDVKNLFVALSDVANFPDNDPNQDAYNAADGIMGGKLYSKFWASETGWTVPSGITEADITDYGNFYRCKQCHGWDLDGNAGAYINRAPKTTRPDVADGIRSSIASSSISELFDAIKNTGGGAVDPTRTADGTNVSLGGNEMPDYGTILSDDEIWDIVKFLKEEAYDVTELYTITTTGSYPDGSKVFSDIGKDGDATTGDTYYATNCSACHGTDGTTLIIEDLSIGQFVRDKCYETQHKVKFGHLGSSMTGFPSATVNDVKNLFVALSNTTNFPDYVP